MIKKFWIVNGSAKASQATIQTYREEGTGTLMTTVVKTNPVTVACTRDAGGLNLQHHPLIPIYITLETYNPVDA